VNAQNCKCLLDTGSDVTLIPAKYVQNMKVKNITHALKAADGTEIAVAGEICLSITLGEYEGVIKGLVTEHMAGIILGIIWLIEHCAV